MKSNVYGNLKENVFVEKRCTTNFLTKSVLFWVEE